VRGGPGLGGTAAALILAVACAGPAAGAAARAADPDAGARAFQKCYACHSVEPGETDTPGPNLRGVVGRPAGALDGFAYSEAMAEAGRDGGLVWTEERLDAFLADPESYLPGTLMSFVGMRDPTEREAVIGYLKSFTN
jgi:cytochrome c